MQPRSLVNASVVIGLGYLLSNVTGFAQRIVVTARFGTGAEYDAFNVANRVPELLFSLLAGGALASAFIPMFAEYLGTERKPHAWALARSTAMLLFGLLSIGAAAAWILAPQIIDLITQPPFSQAQIDQAADLMRVMLPSTIIFGVSGLLMGVLQTNGRFFAPAFAPALYNVGIMIGAIVFAPLGIYGVAVGVVLGACLHLAIQLPSLFMTRGWRSPEAAAAENDPALRGDVSKVVRLMIPRVIGLGATQLNFIVNILIASSLGQGAVSAITLAFVILVLPIAAIAQSVGTALFPTLSAHAARGERAAFSAKLTRALGVVIALSAPAMVGLMVLGLPLVRALFERGGFTAQSSADVAFALACFAVGLIGHATLEITTRGFYAIKDTRRPVSVAVAGVALNIALSLALTQAFLAAGLPGFGGLALANGITTLIEALAMYAWLHRRAHMGGAARVAVGLVKSLLAACAMGLALWWMLPWMEMAPWLALLAIPVGAAVYLAAALVLRSEEARNAMDMLTTRFARLRRGTRSA